MARNRWEKNRGAKRERPSRRRSATGLTLSAIMLFEVSACLLLMLRGNPLDWAALGLAFGLPALAWLSVRLAAGALKADVMLVLLMNFLCGLGVILLYGLSPERGLRQCGMYVLGIGMFVLCALAVRLIRDWKALCWLFIPAGLALLLLPVAMGQETNGAKNWLAVPIIGSFQPSELVKLALVAVLARFCGSFQGVRGMLPGLLFSGGCLLVLMLQRDLGTALMYYLVTLLVFWAATSNMPLTLAGIAGGAAASYAGYELFGHVRTRVAIWLNPWSDALGKGYQLVQALMAIGSGGLLGLGLGMGQSRAIPAYSTDFIFAVLCEQFGILFGLCVVGMYIIMVLRGVAISLKARGPFHAFLALGCSLMLGLQTFVIIGGVIKLIPLTGITMPFVSYGGTSLVACMGMVGMMCGVAAQNARDRWEDERLAEVALP